MSHRVVGLTRDILAQLPPASQSCVFWEADPVTRSRGVDPDAARRLKQDWVSRTLLEWGSCGQAISLDARIAGFVLYAPAALVPSADSFATSPISTDAVLLTTGWVDERHRGAGVGRELIQAVAKDLLRRRLRAVEAFASTGSPSGHGHGGQPCMLPMAFLSAVGFETVRPHPMSPRMRLDLRSIATWRAEVEHAVDRLLGGLRSGAATPT